MGTLRTSEAVEELSASLVVLKTLLMSDLVESTRLMEEMGDRRTAQLFARHDRLARELLGRHEVRCRPTSMPSA